MRTSAYTLVFCLLLLQLLPFNPISINGIKPDYYLLVAIFLGLYHGENTGMVWGLGLGIVEDILAGSYFGLNGFTKVTCGFLAGILKKRLVYENFILHFLISFIFTVFDLSVVIFVTNIAQNPFGQINTFLKVIILSAIYNGVMAIPFFFILDKLGFPGGRDAE